MIPGSLADLGADPGHPLPMLFTLVASSPSIG
jgi:hypothetical protein